MLSSSSAKILGEVLPGDVIASIEEYLPGKGTYVDREKGLIRAALPGVAVVDEINKRVMVRAKREVKLPGPGAEVVGLVTQIRQDVVIVDLYGVVITTPRPRWLYELSSPITSGLPIANVAGEFIKDIHDYYRMGDIIIAKIVSQNPPYTLTTKNPQYGVVYGICSKCGGILRFNTERSVKCERCGNVEKRKASILGKNLSFRINIRRLLVKTHYPW